jgi:hypothetical protein
LNDVNDGSGAAAMRRPISISHDDILLVVDIQNDFCPGGALPVHRGDQV